MRPNAIWQRRRFLKALVLASVMVAAPRSRSAGRDVLFSDYPFKLGVASGTPGANSMVIWTRLCPDPLHGGGMGVEQVPVRWEVAADEHFGDIRQRGTWFAMQGLAHSVHATVEGLAPDTVYYYRFIAGNEVSGTGRTRTLPADGKMVDHLRFALASCQHFEMGYFNAYRHMLADAPDLVCFVGDYIYEYNASAGRVRMHADIEPWSLDGYRNRYAQYRLDADLRAMHESAPWLVTIDDHDVMNDWAGDVAEDLDPRFAERRGNGLQAWFEHQPLPLEALLPGRRLQVYRSLQAGNLARFHVLDDRQYRDPEVCPRPGMGGSNFAATDAACPARKQPGRTLLGLPQEGWLDRQLAQSNARWNVVVQESLVSPLPSPGANGPEFFTDAWDGYPAARDRLIRSLTRHHAANPLIVGGDYHCTIACDIKADFDRPQSRTLGTEFVGTSLTSPGMPQAVLDAKARANPHVRYADATRRGYLLFDLSHDRTDVAIRTTSDISVHDGGCTTTSRFIVEAGRPGVQSA